MANFKVGKESNQIFFNLIFPTTHEMSRRTTLAASSKIFQISDSQMVVSFKPFS